MLARTGKDMVTHEVRHINHNIYNTQYKYSHNNALNVEKQL